MRLGPAESRKGIDQYIPQEYDVAFAQLEFYRMIIQVPNLKYCPVKVNLCGYSSSSSSPVREAKAA